MEIQEIIRLAFLKYRLSGRRSMNTFIFTQAKNNKLTDEQVDNIIEQLETKIAKLEEEKKKQEELKQQELDKQELEELKKRLHIA